MDDVGTIAPKERVNITYRPAVDGVQKEIEIPLKILVLGDFTLQENATPLEKRETVNVDKNNFSNVMDSQNLNLNLRVPDKITGNEDSQLDMTLDFKSMRDFEPDAILAKVPELKKLLDLREALRMLKNPLGNDQKFKAKLKELIQDETTREQLLKELGLKE